MQGWMLSSLGLATEYSKGREEVIGGRRTERDRQLDTCGAVIGDGGVEMTSSYTSSSDRS